MIAWSSKTGVEDICGEMNGESLGINSLLHGTPSQCIALSSMPEAFAEDSDQILYRLIGASTFGILRDPHL